MEVLVVQSEDRDRFRVVYDTRAGDSPFEVDADEQDQGLVGEPSRLGDVPSREEVAYLMFAAVDGGRRWRAVDLVDFVGTRENQLEDFRCEVLDRSPIRVDRRRPRPSAGGSPDS